LPSSVQRGAAVSEETSGLSAVEISKSFRSGPRSITALESFSLDVGRGEFLSLIGPSGCGKSTFLRLAAGLDLPDEGHISIFDESVEYARKEKRIGFVPQALALMPWRTVLENVRLPLEVNRRVAAEEGSKPKRDAVELLEAFGLGDVIHQRPADLSGGMRQRVALARTFLHEPAVMLMDEPFSALDELTADVLRRELLALWQSRRTTVVFVTHSVAEAVLLSDRVAVMSPAPGRVISIVEVRLPRPRGDLVEVSSEFGEVERQIRIALRRANAGGVPR
jgi:NitT/TauT family transport system ATP-binding protein